MYQPASFEAIKVEGDLGCFLTATETGKSGLKRDLDDLTNREVEWLNRLLVEATFPDQIEKSETPFDKAYRFEPLEVMGVVQYLKGASQSLAMEDAPKAAGDVAKGKLLFETRGCLACHGIDDKEATVKSDANQGPNLSLLGAKLTGEKGRKWLYNWIKHPNRYHARTVMPEVMNEAVYFKGADGKPTLSKPDEDIGHVMAYLLSFNKWQPHKAPFTDQPDATDTQTLNDLVFLYLSKAVGSQLLAEKYLNNGISEEVGASLQQAEKLLIGEPSNEKKLNYLGFRTISRLGCAGCHDVPGFEDSKPIGTGLNSWGRKETSQLAFEQIFSYLGVSHGHGSHAAHDDHEDHTAHGPANPDLPGSDGEAEQDTGYYLNEISHHHRPGFIWQKLRAPRSYDYKMTSFKPYDDRLRMPEFHFTPQQREAIITFVLGLVAEPSQAKTDQYLYKPNPRAKAIQEGQRVIEKFNCTGCQMLKQEQWAVEYDPQMFAKAQGSGFSIFKVANVTASEDYPQLQPYFTPDEIKKSITPDRRGLVRTLISATQGEEQVDDDDLPYNYYTLWSPAIMGGIPYRATQSLGLRSKNVNLKEREPMVVGHLPAHGGHLASLLKPLMVQLDKAEPTPVAKTPDDVLAWLPPPLMHEGQKVQTDWLYRFLMDPFPIRPAVALRMPKFNISPADARALVNYFAAVDGADFPYERVPQREAPYFAKVTDQRATYYGDAFKILTDGKNGCTQCHHAGDYLPSTDPKAHGPNLARVYERLRPEFTHDWIMRPKQLLPYTGMPANFTLDAPKFQEYLPEPPTKQITAMRDLLMAYDFYILGLKEVSTKDRVVIPATPAAAGGGQ